MTNIKNFGIKRDKIAINRLLNSSKNMLRDNIKYKSCFDLSRNSHIYPYKPEYSTNFFDKKYNNFLSFSPENINKSNSKLMMNYNTIDENSLKKKVVPKKKKANLTSPISSQKATYCYYLRLRCSRSC